MHDSFGSRSNGPALFRHGCEIMAKFAPHRNVIAFHESGKISDRDYCVLQYVEGLNLREMNVREDPMLEEILSDFSEISRAAVDEDEFDNQDEADFALAKLIEHVRVSVQIVFEELEPKRATGPGAATVH